MPGLGSDLDAARETPWRAWRQLGRILLAPFVRVRLKIEGAEVGSGLRSHGFPIVRRHAGSRIVLGSDVELRNRKGSNILGVAHPVILTTMARGASIMIGDRVGLSGVTITAAKSVTIGAGSLLGSDVLVTDSDHHGREGEEVLAKPIEIGTDVFIGARAVVLKGARIGDGAVIGAAAVVVGDIPAGAVAAGNPARVIRQETKPFS